MKKVLLIDPAYLLFGPTNDKEFSLGLVTIGGYVKHMQPELCSIDYFMPDIIDCLDSKENFDKWMRAIVDLVRDISPDVIGCTTRCDIYPFALHLMEEIKDCLPQTCIILGGPQATHTDLYTMRKCAAIDYIIRGEGELTFYELLLHIINNKKASQVLGITYRDEEGEACRTSDRVMMDSLLVYPDYASVYSKNNHIYISRIEAGRGCPYNCIFCSLCKMWERKYRLLTARQLVQEMEKIYSLNMCTYFLLEHDNLLANPSYAENFLKELIMLHSEFQWGCSARIDNICNIDISLLRKSGCRSIYFGIETGSAKMQKIYNKNIKLDMVCETLKQLEEQGINFTLSFVCGHPEEMVEDLLQTVYLSVKCNTFSYCNGIQIHKLAPLAGSMLLEKYKNDLYLNDTSISDQSDIFLYSKYKTKILQNPEIYSSFYSIPINKDSEMIMEAILSCGINIINCFPKTIYYVTEKKFIDWLQMVESFSSFNNFIKVINEIEKIHCDEMLAEVFDFEVEMYRCSKYELDVQSYEKIGAHNIAYNNTQKILEVSISVWRIGQDDDLMNREKMQIRIWKDFRASSVRSAVLTPNQKKLMELCNNIFFLKNLDVKTIGSLVSKGYLVEQRNNVRV